MEDVVTMAVEGGAEYAAESLLASVSESPHTRSAAEKEKPGDLPANQVGTTTVSTPEGGSLEEENGEEGSEEVKADAAGGPWDHPRGV